MAYTVNSASDSRGDEDQYVADFNRNIGAIVAYKQNHGGDLEHAYQAVTGKPWPSGRSVKITNGRAEMTKDRTVASVLGKYVAPAAAGAAAAFGIPAFGIPGLFGGGAPAAAGGVSDAFLAGAPALGSTEAGVMAGTTLGESGLGGLGLAAPTFGQSVKNFFTNPQNLAKLAVTGAAAVPAVKALTSPSPQNPFADNSALMGRINDSLDMQNARTKQAQPIYDALVNQAYGRTPTRYRGAPPAGYPAGADAPPAGGYVFNAPRFG